MVQTNTFSKPAKNLVYVLIFALLLLGMVVAVQVANNYSTSEPLQLQTVRGGYTNPFPKEGETTQVTFVISFGTTAQGKCRFDLFPNSTVPKMSHEFEETCRHVVAHDIFNWLKENLPDSHKWLADKMLEDPKMLRLVNSLIRKS